MTAETDDSENGTVLRHELACILHNYTMDQPGGGLLGRRLTREEARALAADLSPYLSPIIRTTGRVVSVADVRKERDAAVWRMFRGNNHADVMRQFSVSKRVLQTILARKRRSFTAQNMLESAIKR